MSTTCTPESGTCQQCQGACQRKPGWFKPGEAERAAKWMGLDLQEFFDRYLLVDWWDGSGDPDDGPLANTTFVLSPAIVGATPGEEFGRNPRGTCVFYQHGRCTIHAVKPFECRESWCGMDRTTGRGMHREATESWVDYQREIAELLGRDPEQAGGWTILDELGSMFDRLGGLFGS